MPINNLDKMLIKIITSETRSESYYLIKDINEILLKCSIEKLRLIDKISKMVMDLQFI